MTDKANKNEEKTLPKSRLSRFSHVARMVGGVAGGMLAEGARQLGEGKRPKVSELILTPGNAKRITKQLSAMRGAAMKIGQLLSMETDGLLPKELAAILAQLRDRAKAMPRVQLEQAMIAAYGDDWSEHFNTFDYTPIAAASIGQVHKAVNHEGEELALKIQYPGVVESIDSDVDNIAWLLRISNLIPEQMDISDLLNEAKRQLHDEADYLFEGAQLAAFYATLIDDERYIVPWYYDQLSTKTVLAMEYVAGEPIEEVHDLEQGKRNQLMHNLFELMLREIFELQLVQTDPNFANYRYIRETEQIVLLDFGATRSFTKKFATDYKRLLRAVITKDDEQIIDAAERIGYKAKTTSDEYRQFLVEVFCVALEPFTMDQEFDFANSQLSERISEISERAHSFKEFWQTPPIDILYLHRKLGGMFLLATRLAAQVNVHQLVQPWLGHLR